MIFECHYCPARLPNFSEAVKHFEEKHQGKTEYVILEVTPDMIEPITKGEDK